MFSQTRPHQGRGSGHSVAIPSRGTRHDTTALAGPPTRPDQRGQHSARRPGRLWVGFQSVRCRFESCQGRKTCRSAAKAGCLACSPDSSRSFFRWQNGRIGSHTVTRQRPDRDGLQLQVYAGRDHSLPQMLGQPPRADKKLAALKRAMQVTPTATAAYGAASTAPSAEPQQGPGRQAGAATLDTFYGRLRQHGGRA